MNKTQLLYISILVVVVIVIAFVIYYKHSSCSEYRSKYHSVKEYAKSKEKFGMVLGEKAPYKLQYASCIDQVRRSTQGLNNWDISNLGKRYCESVIGDMTRQGIADDGHPNELERHKFSILDDGTYSCDYVVNSLSSVLEKKFPIKDTLRDCHRFCDNAIRNAGIDPKESSDSYDENYRTCMKGCYGKVEVAKYCKEQVCPRSSINGEDCMKLCFNRINTNNASDIAWTWGKEF